MLAARVNGGRLSNVCEHLDRHPEHAAAAFRASFVGLAAEIGRRDIVDELLRRGAPILPGVQPNPLSQVGDADMLRYLLERGAVVDESALKTASGHGTPEAIQVLLDAGADPTIRWQPSGRNAYDQALRMGRFDNAELLRPLVVDYDLAGWLTTELGPLAQVPRGTVPIGAPFSLHSTTRADHRILVTAGLSASPLPGLEHRAELLLRLPLDPAAMGVDPKWPLDWLFSVVHAGLEGPVLQPWDTIGNGPRPKRLSPDVRYVGSVVVPEGELVTPGGMKILLLSLCCLRPSELRALRADHDVTRAALDAAGLLHGVVTRDRPSVVPRPWWRVWGE